MDSDISLELEFQEKLNFLVTDYGPGNQEGIKEALKICQEDFHCVSLSHQNQIAEAFDMKPTTVKTFMRLNKSLKESVVEHEVICCSGQRCASAGSFEVLNAVTEELGIQYNETTPDGKIRLRAQNCFKKCKMGPNIMIDGKFHHYMDAKSAKELIRSLKK